MAAQSLGFRIVLIWLLAIPSARCAKSTLKVAVCNPGQVPYATVQDDGTLTGYDIGNYLFFTRKSDFIHSEPFLNITGKLQILY
jgi:hypothetical protein